MARRVALPAPTARLFFRTWRPDDVPLALALWGDARVTALIGGPFDEAQVRRRLENELAMEREHGFQYWPIFLAATEEHVGCCGLRPRDVAQGVLELGFHVRASHRGQGLATEAARGVVKHAFEILDARALFAGHHPLNAASRRTLEKLGFRYSHDEQYAATGLEHRSYLLTPDDPRRCIDAHRAVQDRG
jgi:RimJ/RimL family protein N-acetyltransferase